MEIEDCDNRIFALVGVRDRFPTGPSIRIITFHVEACVAVWNLTVIHLSQLSRMLCVGCLICRKKRSNSRVQPSSSPSALLVVVSYRRVFLRALLILEPQLN